MNLMEARTRKRITQWDLSISTGISQSKISLLERGYIMPTPEEEQLILSALGYTRDDITWMNLRAERASCK